MKPLNVVLAIADGITAQNLAASLHMHFRDIAVARSLDDLRHAIPKHRADIVVIDLETLTLEDFSSVRGEYPTIQIVCTHRLADEKLWSTALALGALDCCHPSDVRSIVLAAAGIPLMQHGHAA
jgi:DNA-binding NarL/FixJ family response regulator